MAPIPEEIFRGGQSFSALSGVGPCIRVASLEYELVHGQTLGAEDAKEDTDRQKEGPPHGVILQLG